MNRLRMLLRQFPFLIALRIFLVDLARKVLDPCRMVSYSQDGEDRLIEYYLSDRDRSRVYYVDIGCHKPDRMSNTLCLYQRGARGLAVDGNPLLVEEYRRVRPRDTVVCACVSDRARDAVFTIPQRSAMSTLSAEFEEKHLVEEADVVRHNVRTITAQQLFEEHNVPEEFDLLNVDVEGHDLEVLRSFDLKRYRPHLIVIEMLDTDLDDPAALSADPIYRHLNHNGYKLAAYAARNGYFLRRDDA